MNYTTNYHLPQWAKEDRIMMEDFNDAMSRIEEGMTDGAKPLYVMGAYKGTGEVQEIGIGFRPSAVLVHGCYSSNVLCDANYDAFIIQGYNNNKIYFTDTGFVVKDIAQHGIYPMVNEKGRDYVYVALR